MRHTRALYRYPVRPANAFRRLPPLSAPRQGPTLTAPAARSRPFPSAGSASLVSEKDACKIGARTYLLLCLRLELEVVDVQTALGLLLLARPATGTLARVALAALDGAVPVADAAVALVEQLVPGYGVLGDVPLHEVEVPREERVELEEAGAVDFERLEVGTVAAL